MSNKENRTLTIVKEDGSEVLCEILFTTYDENFKKNYVVFEVLDGEGKFQLLFTNQVIQPKVLYLQLKQMKNGI